MYVALQAAWPLNANGAFGLWPFHQMWRMSAFFNRDFVIVCSYDYFYFIRKHNITGPVLALFSDSIWGLRNNRSHSWGTELVASVYLFRHFMAGLNRYHPNTFCLQAGVAKVHAQFSGRGKTFFFETVATKFVLSLEACYSSLGEREEGII